MDRPQLLDFQQSESIAELAEALSKFQGEIKDPEHDGRVDYQPLKGPRVNYTYATLSAVMKVARPVLSKNGLAIMQGVTNLDNGKIIVVTQLMHKSGQWIRSKFGLDYSTGKPQEQAGIITYDRRYSLAPMLGISSETDVDGSEPAKEEEPRQKQQEQKTKKEPEQKLNLSDSFQKSNKAHLKMANDWLKSKRDKIDPAFWMDILDSMEGQPMNRIGEVAKLEIEKSLEQK
jgi:hypothetical protein